MFGSGAASAPRSSPAAILLLRSFLSFFFWLATVFLIPSSSCCISVHRALILPSTVDVGRSAKEQGEVRAGEAKIEACMTSTHRARSSPGLVCPSRSGPKGSTTPHNRRSWPGKLDTPCSSSNKRLLLRSPRCRRGYRPERRRRQVEGARGRGREHEASRHSVVALRGQ